MTGLFAYLLNLILIFQINGFLCQEVVDNELKISTELDVLILGAGYSGLGAARALHKHNVNNFLVLEASDYIGGRVKGVSVEGSTIPLGAGWMHHVEEKHSVFKLAKKYKLKRSADKYEFSKIVFLHGDFGYPFNKFKVSSTEKLLRKAIGTYEKNIKARVKKGLGDISGGSALRWAGWKADERLKEAVEYFFFDFENGETSDLISSSQMGYTGAGEDMIITDRRGYSYPLLQEIKPFAKKIILKSAVQRIVRLKDKYLVMVTDGRKYYAKHVIVSFSSGVLLAQKTLFTPELPSWKMEALSMVPMAHYCKFFFKFPYQFWHNSTYIVIATKFRGEYMHWQNLNLPNLFEGSKILLATVTGKICQRKHLLSDREITSEAMAVLRKVYKNVPQPLRFLRNSWSTNPYFMGAYSMPATGITKEDYAALSHPLHKSLWFTGEYANMEDFGCTNGALDHGLVIGGQVAKCMIHGDCPADTP